jgi:hypothetical protein
MGPNRVGVSLHLRTETDPVSETSCFSSNYLESGRWAKSENPVILCAIDHRQNPIESIRCHYAQTHIIKLYTVSFRKHDGSFMFGSLKESALHILFARTLPRATRRHGSDAPCPIHLLEKCRASWVQHPRMSGETVMKELPPGFSSFSVGPSQ